MNPSVTGKCFFRPLASSIGVALMPPPPTSRCNETAKPSAAGGSSLWGRSPLRGAPRPVSSCRLRLGLRLEPPAARDVLRPVCLHHERARVLAPAALGGELAARSE